MTRTALLRRLYFLRDGLHFAAYLSDCRGRTFGFLGLKLKLASFDHDVGIAMHVCASLRPPRVAPSRCALYCTLPLDE
jgi:hypothetical protein